MDPRDRRVLPSSKLGDGTELGVEEAFVGAHGLSVAETGGVVTEATIAGVVACLAVDQALYGGGQNAQAVGVERMLTEASNRRPRI